jgi:CubicO group peptidase (beta-lactamase class C family)
MSPLFLLLLPAALLQDTLRAPALRASVLQSADSIAAAEFAKDSLGSITVGIVSGSTLVWAKSYGFTDSARTQLATPSTIYRIASVTKQFTALMLLQLVERNRVHLSDPVERFFPELRQIPGRPAGSSPITVVQLATMTSGLARDPADARQSQTGRPQQWERILIAALSRTAYAREPGAGYGYSNIGYGVLGIALARAAGEDYIAYQERHILRPLGMTSTTFELNPALAARLATGVDWDRGVLNYADAAMEHRNGLGFRVPGGGLYSTVGDVAKIVSLELGFCPDSVVRRETLKIRDNVPVASYPSLDYGYGLGFQAMRWGNTVAVGHSGNLAGYTSMVLYDPERHFGVIVLRSAGGGEADAGRLAGRVFRKIRASIRGGLEVARTQDAVKRRRTS